MIVEDGAGKVDANSYVSVAYADDYFLTHGITEWGTLTQSQKEICLIKATDYIDTIFDWYGVKASDEQALAFPRINLFSKDGYEIKGIPNNLKQAVCEAGILLTTQSTLFITNESNGVVTSERIGDLSFTYDVSQKVQDKTLYDTINLRLRGLFRDTNKKKIMSAQVRRHL